MIITGEFKLKTDDDASLTISEAKQQAVSYLFGSTSSRYIRVRVFTRSSRRQWSTGSASSRAGSSRSSSVGRFQNTRPSSKRWPTIQGMTPRASSRANQRSSAVGIWMQKDRDTSRDLCRAESASVITRLQLAPRMSCETFERARVHPEQQPRPGEFELCLVQVTLYISPASRMEEFRARQ